MPTISVLDKSGKKTGEIELAEAVFGVKVNKVLLHSAVVAHLANLRQGTQSALTRAEVRGGGAKPWRQKGTGRARQGSTRAPQWVHGGVAFAPKPRDYSKAMNKKQKRVAMRSALSAKVLDEKLIVLDSVAFDAIKTKDGVAMLSAIGVTGKTLIVSRDVEKNMILSTRNIEGVKTTISSTLNIYDILKYDNLVVAKDAIAHIEEVYA